MGGRFLLWEKVYVVRNASILYDANFCANILGCGFTLLIIDRKIEGFKKIAYLMLLTYAIYRTGSRGTLLSLVVCIFMYVIIFSKLKIYKKISLIIIMIIISIYVYGYLDSVDFFRTYQGSNYRGEMWQWAAKMIMKSPFVGYGYASVGNLLLEAGFVNTSTHNSLLDFAFSYGIPATIVYFVILSKALYNGAKNGDRRLFLTMLFMLINSNTILYSFGGVGLSSILFTILLGDLNMRQDKNIITHMERGKI